MAYAKGIADCRTSVTAVLYSIRTILLTSLPQLREFLNLVLLQKITDSKNTTSSIFSVVDAETNRGQGEVPVLRTESAHPLPQAMYQQQAEIKGFF